MKPVIVFCLALTASTSLLFGQLDELKLKHPACELPPAPFQGYLYVPAPEPTPQFRSGATIVVNYLSSGTLLNQTCTAWPPDAQAAMDYAAGIWAGLLNTNTAITVDACWATSLSGSTLGTAGTSYRISNISGETSWYPMALFEYLNNDPARASVEIQAAFSASRTDWHFELDGQVPSSQIDFVTVALHEIGHGLGFSGFSNIDDGLGEDENVECDGVNGHGCYGSRASEVWVPDIYSRQVENASQQQLTSITNPSLTVGELLLGQNDGLYIGSASVSAANGGSSAKVYTPENYASGSSYSHWDPTSFPGELMKPVLNSGQAIHHPGLALNLMEDIGWPVSSGVLPVEWVSFTAEAGDRVVQLQWETAREANNAGFEVQRSRDGRDWESLDFVKAEGEAARYTYIDGYPCLGMNYYRLFQADFDGRGEYSDIEVAYFDLAKEVEIGIAPNPATRALLVGYPGYNNPQPYHIYDALGKACKRGQLNSSRQEITLENLPEGTYWLKVGEEPALPFVKL